MQETYHFVSWFVNEEAAHLSYKYKIMFNRLYMIAIVYTFFFTVLLVM